MVVVEPDFEKYPLAYLYGRPKDLQEWSYTPDAIERVLAIVNTIVGKTCASCGGAANAAFYRKHEFEWPHFERLQAPSSYLCSRCIAEKVAPLISSASAEFSEGLYEPRDAEGIYHAQEW